MNFERNVEQFEILIEAINKCQTIESIDLSCNELSDRYGSLISMFVQA
jgi:Ran GTPase-activating protein (RanGAP) involved in mRNA processing and transport